MKSILILGLLFLAGCDSGSHENAGRAHEHEPAPDSIQTVKTGKWKADAATWNNVNALKRLLENKKYDEGKNGSELAAAFQTGLDRLVAQCTMKGPAHDALHHWLEETMRRLSEFKNAGSNKQDAFQALHRQVMTFDQQFE